MLDHLIFNKLKWWSITDNQDTLQANGKNWLAIPKQVTLPRGSNVKADDGTSVTTDQDATLVISGVGQDVYYTNSTVHTDGSSGIYTTRLFNRMIRKNQVKNVIWGGRTYLTHWYQWLKALITRKVVGA